METTRNKTGFFTCLYMAIASLVLSIIKLFVGLASGSTCVLIDCYSSFADTLNGIIACIGFLILSKDKSNKFPNGYGRLEYLLSFIISVILITTSIGFIIVAGEQFMFTTQVFFSVSSLLLIIFSILTRVFTTWFFYIQNKKVNSIILKTLGLNSFISLITGVISLVTFLLAIYANARLDAILAVIMSIFILVNGIIVSKKSLFAIIGKNGKRHEKEEIENYLKDIEEIDKIKDISFFDFGFENDLVIIDLKFNSECDTEKLITLSESIKNEIKNRFNINCKITVV